MFLQKMELQGFKTFAQKTSLEFPAPGKGSHALTVVVGPNGSGKSNLADAIRWCLGEQSMKLLRGKKTEDIIFSGSEGRGRAGFAEVTLVFNNEDKSLKVDFTEVTITRRLYRDGESEYLLNGQAARLSDIQLLLAEAGVGQRTYSVIGQGMIDHVLTSSPEERKIFFDDATGVRGFQIKRHQAMLKLQKSADNLADVEMLLREIEPRLNLLRRQVKRLSEREKTENELREVSAAYYGTLWWNAVDEKRSVEKRITASRELVDAKKAELAAGDEKLLAMEKAQVGTGASGEDTSATQALQSAYKAAQQELSAAKTAQFAAERELELARVRAQSTWSPLPLTDIVSEVKEIAAAHEGLVKRLRDASELSEVNVIADELDAVFSRSKKLKDRLTKPNPEDFTPDPAMLGAVDASKTRAATAEAAVKAAEGAMDAQAKQATESRTEVFAFQRELRRLQQELSAFEAQANAVSIDLARLETRMEGLEKEMQDAIPGGFVAITAEPPAQRVFEIGQAHDRMLRLRHQLELIGGIDDDVVKEHGEAEERFGFLSTQVADLRSAITSTEKIVDELDEQIRKQSESSFKVINAEFQKYFKVLFGGGSCSLVKMSKDDIEKDAGVTPDRAIEEVAAKEVAEREETAESISGRINERKDAILGIDIQATPPGKKLKALNLLSGGERALTSIALLSAIMATNPSPFVVLDEVDAALDEANTVRFANILNELRKLTQFIVVTHNRATMEKGDVLYGVTMGDDGVSKLLSVKLEDYAGNGTARR